MFKLFIPTFVLLLSACSTVYNHTIPVESIDASTTASTETAVPENIDLNSVDITVKENPSPVTPVENEIIGYSNSSPETSSPETPTTDVVKPQEITSVTSKPANQLLGQANQAAAAGNYNKANVLLDRALSISPRNAKLWHKKSQIMYFKEDYRQAASMAMRSNTMTSNTALKKQNWRVIANARKKMGDLSGTEQARKFARQ